MGLRMISKVKIRTVSIFLNGKAASSAAPRRLTLLLAATLFAGTALPTGPGAKAADKPIAMPVKAAPIPYYDWSGFYVGAHVGYGTGSSDWTAQNTAVPGSGLNGSTDLFSRAGGLLGGFQAGYNYMFRSHLVLGVETDVTFPNYLNGSQSFSSPTIGQASTSEAVEFAGTVRGRAGYALNHWLVYSTGGFAFAYDQLSRTQQVGTPSGGTAVPDTVESQMLGRIGWTAGAGVEYAFAPNLTAKLEYLFSDFGNHSNFYPQGVQRFDSNLALQEVRLGLNYRPFEDAAKGSASFATPGAPAVDIWALHAQTTYVQQYAPPFHAPYAGANSFQPNISRETWDATLYVGLRLWDGAEAWINPEIDQGFGLSDTTGLAGYPSGEAFKIGSNYPYARLQRAFIRQTIDLGGETQKVEADINQFASSQKADRVVITVGKFSAADIFDTNKYAHDTRNDVMNWALIDAGTFDFAADAWGYTLGGAAEWYWDRWALRAGVFDLPAIPNSTNLDPTFGQFQSIAEIEERHALWGQPGKVKLTGFLTRARNGSYVDAIQLAAVTGGPADIAAVRQYRSRTGAVAGLEQQIIPDVGMFARAGIGGGGIESDNFTDIDQTISAGLSVAGKQWGRPDDTIGVAGVVNTISSVHQAFLNAGGLGILVGDGQLPHPGPEQILETYYSYALPQSWKLTFDYQYFVNPAYNRDRGPVSVFGTRLHWQF
jgi:high affinity Mn2+ porin